MLLGRTPLAISAVGRVDTGTGVDLQASVSLAYPALVPDENKKNDERPRPNVGPLASLHYGFLTESGETTSILCERGRITINGPSHCPTSVTVERKLPGRGEKETKTTNFPLPVQCGAVAEGDGETMEYFYPNSAGFAYEAAAVCRHIAAGKLEAPECPLDDTLAVMKILDEVRKQIGMDIPKEAEI
mmetsp:Transcript_9676/g.21503  ORF Transcript_9676/g.21503 Transcript_9676/m.21503 type:complete len:187 (+) Transcript_9676:898-1458(+)